MNTGNRNESGKSKATSTLSSNNMLMPSPASANNFKLPSSLGTGSSGSATGEFDPNIFLVYKRIIELCTLIL